MIEILAIQINVVIRSQIDNIILFAKRFYFPVFQLITSHARQNHGF